ncbi:MAG: nitrate reductase molybdenum cofactor assembly chaperone [Pseudomonadales bacterium]
MQILQVIAHLMHYPSAEVSQHQADMAMLISESREISPDQRAELLALLNEIYDADLMDAQEEYGLLFDQGRSMSLHVFEHVHGESRDRGQAMVDLMSIYEQNGFEMDSKELPDYLPLFLEYLARQPDLIAREWLADVGHIIARIGARLIERESSYNHLFTALLTIAGKPELLASELVEVAGEEPDNTPEALDKEWEEVAVTWGADNLSCPSMDNRNKAADANLSQPLNLTDAPQHYNPPVGVPAS